MNMSSITKHRKDSLIDLTRRYANNNEECIKYFFNSKWPTGFYCEKCGCTHYYFIKRGNVFKCKECGHEHHLLAGTVFQDSKLDLYKIILGLYLFFVNNKGISAVDMMNSLHVNYKTACKFNRKCRILMSQSNSNRVLDSLFYEVDAVQIGAKSTGTGKQGCGSDQQPFLVMLSTKQDNKYPMFIKLHPIRSESYQNIAKIIHKSMFLSKDRTLNTDGDTCYDKFDAVIKVVNEKIVYTEKNHRLFWLNTVVGNIKNQITGIYHGVTKRDLPLFLNEQAWRFNHRDTRNNILDKVSKYLNQSSPITNRQLVYVLNIATSFYAKTACV